MVEVSLKGKDAPMLDGFYSGFMTSASGHGLVLFVFRNGVVVGVDAGGVRFDGTYRFDEAAHQFVGQMIVSVPPNTTLIQGATSGPEGMTYEVPFNLPHDFLSQPFIPVKTPLGSVNVRLEKVRDLGAI